MANKHYRLEVDDPLPVIKWLRANGTRGIDWDFRGSGKKIDIWIMDHRLEVMWIMTHEMAK